MSQRHPLRAAFRRILDSRPDVHLLGEAVELSAATRGLRADHPSRVHLLPAADAALMGVAVGMAVAGGRPVVELADSRALWGALQQLGQEASAMSGEIRAPVVLRVPLAPGEVPPLSVVVAVDFLTVAVASNRADLVALLDGALSWPGPVVLFEPAEALEREGEPDSSLGLGHPRTLRHGDHVSLLAAGAGVGAALGAADALAHEGIEAHVVDLRTVSPLHLERVAEAVDATGRPVFVGVPGTTALLGAFAGFLRLESPPTWVESSVDAVVTAARQSVHF